MNDPIKAYAEAAESLQKYFKLDYSVFPEFNTEYYWNIDKSLRQINFWDERPENTEDPEYSHEIVHEHIKYGKDYTLVEVNDCFGNKYYCIWDNSKQVQKGTENEG